MTKDTERALEAIRPMAEALGVKVEADEKFLYCNGQAIGISCNSTWATIMEFVGYVTLKVYAHDRQIKPDKAFSQRVTRYWFTREQVKMIMAERNENG